jgi:hypothetical protein
MRRLIKQTILSVAPRPPRWAFERLERIAGKLARCVLRGRGGSNVALLPEQIEGVGRKDILGQVGFVAGLFRIAA